MNSLTVAAVQVESIPFVMANNLERTATFIESAAEKGAQLVVLPELFHTGYTYDPRLRDHGEELDGPTSQWLGGLSRKLSIHVGGCIIEQEGRRLYDTFVLAHPDGNLSFYRKRFPAFFEYQYFTAGSEIGIFETSLGRIGIMICWDMVHARLARELAGSVDLLIISAAWPDLTRGSIPLPGIAHWMTNQPIKQPARLAARLGVPVVFANQTGVFETRVPGLGWRYSTSFAGRSAIVDAAGAKVATTCHASEEVVTAEVGLASKKCYSFSVIAGSCNRAGRDPRTVHRAPESRSRRAA